MTTDPSTAYVWSFLPNWAEPFRVIREYKTTVWASRSGKEQRRALRTTPRLTFEFDGLFNGDRRREFRGLMAKAQNKPMVMPDWSRRIELAGATAETATSFTVTSVPGWLVDGRALFLYNGADRPTVVYVSTVVGTTVTITSPLAEAWAAGSEVLPGCVGFMGPNTALKAYTDDVSAGSFVFAVEPTSEPEVVPPAASVTFNGREVCLIPPNWRDALGLTLSWAPEIVDFDHGAIEYGFPIHFQSGTRKALFSSGSRDDTQDLVDFVDRMKGQRGEFYLPSDESDLAPISSLTSGTASMTVAGTDTALNYDASTVYAAICVLLTDGTRLYNTVTSIGTSAGNSVFVLGSNWASTVTVAEIARVSWMPAYRLASDAISIDFLTDAAAEAELAVRVLEDLVAE